MKLLLFSVRAVLTSMRDVPYLPSWEPAWEPHTASSWSTPAGYIFYQYNAICDNKLMGQCHKILTSSIFAKKATWATLVFSVLCLDMSSFNIAKFLKLFVYFIIPLKPTRGIDRKLSDTAVSSIK